MSDSYSSWVYVFSRFTPEALLFEVLGIFILLGLYAGYWLVKKKNRGAADENIPSDVIKGYLNTLITDAENLRAQLFGLLRSAQADPAVAAAGAAHLTGALTQAISADPALLAKIQDLETKMREQEARLAAMLAERDALNASLEAAKAGAGAAAATAGPDRAAEIAELQAKIQALEAKLAEYSIIEDDLANLKRLQQENAQLKAALGGGAAAQPSAAQPAAAAPAPQPAQAAPAAPVAEAAKDGFEKIVDKVEQSLQQPAAAPVEAAPAAPAAEAAPAASTEKSDADLVQEFEKMLNA